MPVSYVVVPKKNPSDPIQPQKYYTQAKNSGRIDVRQLASDISEMSTISSADTMAVLEVLLQLLPKHIAQGKIVSLGDFGDFRLSLKSNGSETADKVTSDNIQSNHLRFRPGKEIRKVLNNVDYIKVV